MRWSAAVGLAILLHAAVAGAEVPAVGDAVQLKNEGDSAMLERRYADALDLYGRAYAKDPAPATLFNRGRALEALARYPEALDAFEQFAREAPADVRARVPQLDALLASLRERVTTLKVRADRDGARVLLRGVQVGVTPVAVPMRVLAGEGALEIVADGCTTDRRDLRLLGGAELDVDAHLACRAGETRAVVPSTSITSRWWFWVAAGTVVAAGATLAVVLLSTAAASKGDYPPGQLSAPLVRF